MTGETPAWKCHAPFSKGEEIVYSPKKISGNRGYQGKKKKADKVKAFRDRFETGFKRKLIEEEGATEEEALAVVDKIWTIINDAASYMFCAAHAMSMACDSLYIAWLKVHYPYELYTSMLKVYTEKKNKEKISAIASEMKRYKNIRVIPGMFGQDNRDWYIDKRSHTISQNLSSIKFISPNVPESMLELANTQYDTFCDLLFAMQDMKINKRQIIALIMLDYFIEFGQSGKLLAVYHEFKEGKNKVYGKLAHATIEKRMNYLRQFEANEPDKPISLIEKIRVEDDYIGRCISFDRTVDNRLYYIEEVDDAFSVRLKLYSMQRGTSGEMRVLKNVYKSDLKVGQSIRVNKIAKRNKCVFRNGKAIPIAGQYNYWIEDYSIIDDIDENEEVSQ